MSIAIAVPVIEVADHADALCIRRPHGEARAGDAVMHFEMRTELLVNVVMIALTEQVQIEIGERRAS